MTTGGYANRIVCMGSIYGSILLLCLFWNGCYLMGHHRLLLVIFYSSHTSTKFTTTAYLMADVCAYIFMCARSLARLHKHTLRYTKSKSILNVFGIYAIYFIDVACSACSAGVCARACVCGFMQAYIRYLYLNTA